MQFVVEGKDASITFTANVHRLALLKKVIALRATGAVGETREWKSDGPDTEQLGGLASQWTGGYVGVGERIFRYRNHNVRALLWLATFYLVTTQAPAVEAALGFNDRYVFDAWSVVWFVAPTALLAWTGWRYRAGGIIVSSDAVTECTPFGRRTIRWGDVESYRQVGEESLQAYGVVRGRNGEKVRFWIAISDSEELMDIIRTRVTRASGSWMQKDAILSDIDGQIGTE